MTAPDPQHAEWNLTQLYTGIDDPVMAADRERARELVAAFVTQWSTDRTYLADVAALAQAMREYDALLGSREFSLPLYYLHLATLLDQESESLRAAKAMVVPLVKTQTGVLLSNFMIASFRHRSTP